MDITLGVVATVFSLIFGYMGYQKGLKDESKKIGKNEGTLTTDIQYIKRRTDEVLLEQKDTNKNMSALTERIVRVEENILNTNEKIKNLEEDFKDCKRTKVHK